MTNTIPRIAPLPTDEWTDAAEPSELVQGLLEAAIF